MNSTSEPGDERGHLQIIQGGHRPSANSFHRKAWSVVLVSALLALGAKDVESLLVPLALLPALAFWGLDGYFLWQERLFRKLYDEVRRKEDGPIDFSMDTSSVTASTPGWIAAICSKTLVMFHGAVTATILIVLAVACAKGG